MNTWRELLYTEIPAAAAAAANSSVSTSREPQHPHATVVRQNLSGGLQVKS